MFQLGQVVSHSLNDKARGIITILGESAKNNKPFAIVDWFIDPATKKVEAKRHSLEELVEL